MATYNISSLLSRLAEIKQDGYSFVDFTELSADDEFPESLHFDALDEFETVDYEEIESIDLDNLPDSTTNRHSVDDLCGTLLFTYKELGLLENALSNTLQFIKQESTNDSYTSEEKREMKKDAVEFRNLQAKLAHFLKGVVSVK